MLKAYLICRAIEMLKIYSVCNRQIEARSISFITLIGKSANAAYLHIVCAIFLCNDVAEELHKCIARMANYKLLILEYLICRINIAII